LQPSRDYQGDGCWHDWAKKTKLAHVAPNLDGANTNHWLTCPPQLIEHAELEEKSLGTVTI
jgi:hypothetical protein